MDFRREIKHNIGEDLECSSICFQLSFNLNCGVQLAEDERDVHITAEPAKVKHLRHTANAWTPWSLRQLQGPF
jgi:hypothetical protein